MKRKLNIYKTVITLMILHVIQIITIITLLLVDKLNQKEISIEFIFFKGNLFVYLLLILAVLNSLITVHDMYTLSKNHFQYDMLKDTLEELESLNKKLRAQRHDFMNHLQVVYSLSEMGEYTEVQNYIERIYNDIQKVNEILKTSNPAVNALLQVKKLSCEKRGIVLNLQIKTTLAEIPIPSWEFCRILGNIIDNAMFAVQGLKNGGIEVALFEDIKTYGFYIKNNGLKIPAEYLDKIFLTGFTTKGNQGEGMGLAIVKDILTQYGGEINVKSSAEETLFEGWIPKSEKAFNTTV